MSKKNNPKEHPAPNTKGMELPKRPPSNPEPNPKPKDNK